MIIPRISSVVCVWQKLQQLLPFIINPDSSSSCDLTKWNSRSSSQNTIPEASGYENYDKLSEKYKSISIMIITFS